MKRLLFRALVALGCATFVGCAEALPETPPKQVTESSFHYPEELWDAEVEGETTVRLFVTPEGAADSVQVDRSSGYAAFDTAAVRGASELRFEPARRGEEPIGRWILLPVRFEMPADSATRDTP